MKNKAYKFAKIKRQLNAKKQKGIPFVIWVLSLEQLEFIKDMGYSATPYLYKIKTTDFFGRKPSLSILKEIYRAYKYNNRKYIVKQLNHKELKILKEHGIQFWPYKYKICLIAK